VNKRLDDMVLHTTLEQVGQISSNKEPNEEEEMPIRSSNANEGEVVSKVSSGALSGMLSLLQKQTAPEQQDHGCEEETTAEQSCLLGELGNKRVDFLINILYLFYILFILFIFI